jgi:hypothetical protein
MHSYGTEKINVREYRRGNQYRTIQRNGNIVYTRHDEEKQNKTHNTICVGHHYIQTNRNNINQKKHDITEILLKVALNTITLTLNP